MYEFLWYVLIGALIVNGVPHFVAGAAGQIFRSPFGRRSSPGLNLGWGLTNFIAASLLVIWRVTAQTPGTGDVIALLAGVWLAVVGFGFGAKYFYPTAGLRTDHSTASSPDSGSSDA